MSKYLKKHIALELKEHLKKLNDSSINNIIENKDDLYNFFISFLEETNFPVKKLELRRITFNDVATGLASKDSLKFHYHNFFIEDDKTVTEKFDFIIVYENNKLNIKFQNVELENDIFEKDIKITTRYGEDFTFLEILCHRGGCSITFTDLEEQDKFFSMIDYVDDEDLDKYIDTTKLIDYERNNFQNHKDYNDYFFQYYKIGKIIENNANNIELLGEIKKSIFLLKTFSQEEIETFTLLYDIDFSVFNKLSHNTLETKETNRLKI